MLHLSALAAAGLFALTAGAAPEDSPGAAAEPKPEFNWVQGPKLVSLAGEVAQVKLMEEEAFLDGPQSIKLLEKLGNVPDEDVVGMIRPLEDGADWLVVFKYEASGYVKDDEKDNIDADGLLKNIREGTEEGNEYRKEHGAPGLHVLRWSDPPHYDASSHNLTWGLLAKDDNGGEVVNYQVRILGREGFISATLVDEPKLIETSKASFTKVLERFAYKPGKTYAEWRQGDKVAEYGLTALVAAGAGAAALKMGLFSKLFGVLAKFFKVIILGVAAGAAAVARFFKKLFGGRSSNPDGP
ncbi:MAG TPA: DUF2167 domain-containing protein [Myxococcales bacterium]|nr:DUF2167 domain-containing protein [Myxococcales bacterium]